MIRPQLFFAHLFGPGVEPGYRPVHLPKLDIVAIDESPRGFDGGLIINTIQLNHANGPVVEPNDIRTIDRHFDLQVTHAQDDANKSTARSGLRAARRKRATVGECLPGR